MPPCPLEPMEGLLVHDEIEDVISSCQKPQVRSERRRNQREYEDDEDDKLEQNIPTDEFHALLSFR